jgi:hypothetical protein
MLRTPEALRAARCRQGERPPRTTRRTGTGRRSKGRRSYPPPDGSTGRRELPGHRRRRRKPMPSRRTTDRPPRPSSRRGCTRPLPKWRRRERARGARWLFSGDLIAATLCELYPAGRRSGNKYRFKGSWSGFDYACGLLRLPLLDGRKDFFRRAARLDLQDKVNRPGFAGDSII